MRLSELKVGEHAIIKKVYGQGQFRKRILEMGFVQGKEICTIENAPLQDPIHYKILGYDVSLRRRDAQMVEVSPLNEFADDTIYNAECQKIQHQSLNDKDTFQQDKATSSAVPRLRIALLGNPNCGKTSLFNQVSGANEHTGNYSGVTIEAKTGYILYGGYRLEIIDLPGSYSLSPYSPEERYILDYLTGEKRPDVILNIVDSCNLERNLYLTMQLKELGLPQIVALNMYDELERRGDKLDYVKLSQLLDLPMIPTICRTGLGLNALFEELIALCSCHQQKKVEAVAEGISKDERALEKTAQDEEALADERYALIDEYLRKSFVRKRQEGSSFSDKLDKIITNKYLGFLLFFSLMYLMFYATFELGAYPMDWIEGGVGLLGETLGNLLPDGPVKDLCIDGIIGGVGGVIIFLPNILILYLFISFFEDSGYMSRAAFIMDRLMSRMGLHGKSFIPLVMGFGCNVPAIMATRSIESRKSRMLTMLVLPFMSCSARLPVYILIAGVVFPDHSSLVLFGLYLFGIITAIICAKVMELVMFKGEDMPFVMELPPYRLPTAKAVLRQMWSKAKQYLAKMGTVILFASIVIWFLSYFPLHQEERMQVDQQIENLAENKSLTSEELEAETAVLEANFKQLHQEESYIGKLGKMTEPVLQPLGFDWKMGVSLLTGLAAKEVVVSTLGVIYTGDDDDSDEAQERLSDRIQQEKRSDGTPAFTPLVAISFLIFVLIYFPCVATVIAIAKEGGHWLWGLFTIVFSCSLAWILSFIVYQLGSLLLYDEQRMWMQYSIIIVIGLLVFYAISCKVYKMFQSNKGFCDCSSDGCGSKCHSSEDKVNLEK